VSSATIHQSPVPLRGLPVLPICQHFEKATCHVYIIRLYYFSWTFENLANWQIPFTQWKKVGKNIGKLARVTKAVGKAWQTSTDQKCVPTAVSS
jgi:hypothetical protein